MEREEDVRGNLPTFAHPRGRDRHCEPCVSVEALHPPLLPPWTPFHQTSEEKETPNPPKKKAEGRSSRYPFNAMESSSHRRPPPFFFFSLRPAPPRLPPFHLPPSADVQSVPATFTTAATGNVEQAVAGGGGIVGVAWPILPRCRASREGEDGRKLSKRKWKGSEIVCQAITVTSKQLGKYSHGKDTTKGSDSCCKGGCNFRIRHHMGIL
ncbi:hypothetical protein BJ875DRAFT_292008 [Amylocarpus encephaloides]|uniref:Uncharacterized protein n=1 Tax=Amylocarpus encephaloides TaxID=45428 RepID=A0A9P7YKT2_9HELO|nr:hypothetical protein BJ875DRAFT_292008 [Amylocarpus encephaloides]